MLALLVVVSVSFAELAIAQDSTEIAALYGRGVHAFFAGNLSDAENAFTEVINSGSTDPRVYYFRGLVRMRQGGECAGDQDFQLGAMFEARDPGRRYAIGNALQRIQGPERIALEKFRRQGRVDKVQERRTMVRDRYENLRNREAEVLHQSDPVPLEKLVEPSVEVRRTGQGAVTTPAPAVQSPTPQPVIDPTPADVVDPAPVESTPAPVEDTTDDLFGEEPAADTTPEVETEPTTEPSAESPTDSADPFGGTSFPAPAVVTPPAGPPTLDSAADDPFGATEEDVPASEPATETDESASAEDPFGGGEAEAPAAESAAESTEDPFGETAPSTESAAEATTEEAAEAPATESTEEATTEEAAASEDPFGSTEPADTEEEEADEAAEDADAEEAVTEDPFGGSTEESTEDPFGASDSTEGEADSAEGESTETGDTTEEGEAESTEDAPADEAAEEDPFGGF